MPKSKGKLAHLGGRPAKPHGRPAMSYGLPALVKFLCGPHNSTKYVVILGLAVMVSYGNNVKLLKFLIFEVFFLLPMILFCPLSPNAII
jgi:hypothetical protein